MIKQVLYIKVVFLLVFSFFPCFAYGNVGADGLKKVSVRLQWKNQFEYAGFYIAKEKGFYKDAGLDVTIKEWEYGVNIPDEVLSSSEYGVARPSVLIEMSKGKDLVILASIYQANPLVVLTDKSLGIDSIKKFKGKRIMITEDHILDSSLVAMLNSQGVKTEDVQIIKHSFDPGSLLNGETDLMAAYISNEPFTLRELGGEPLIFSPKNYGFNFYNDILVVSRSYLRRNPQEVQKFTQATLKGFEYAFSHIEKAVDIVYEKYNSLQKTKEALLYEAETLKKMAYYKTEVVGTIDSNRLGNIYNVYLLLGLADPGLDMHHIVYDNIALDQKLTKDEKEYLATRNISVCISPEWHSPFYDVDKNGNAVGLGVDYLHFLKKRFNLNFSIVKTHSWDKTRQLIKEGRCDILPFEIESKEKSELLNFTSPYMDFPVVITTRNDVRFVNGSRDLAGKPVVFLKDHYLKYFFQENPSSLDLREAESANAGLAEVSRGKAFAFIDSLPCTIYALQHSQYNSELKVSGRLAKDLKISVGVRKDDEKLFHIIQKCFNNITHQERKHIIDKWFTIEYAAQIDYVLIAEIVGGSFLIFAILLYWNRKIAHMNKVLQESRREIKKQNETLKIISSTDKLTQLYNRGKIDEILQGEIENSLMAKECFGICLLDIDFFKKINDTYGHQAGDRVLVDLAGFLVSHTRASDYVGRWGGEEFLIIFPQIKVGDLEVLAEKLRQEIKELSFGDLGHITVSLGITMFQKNDTTESIIKRADEALYKVKNSGRDGVIRL